DRYCRKCPAGTYVLDHCKEQNGSSVCSRCQRNEFTEYPNDLSKCLRCRVCREDQVELSPCQADRNTQCACRNGTFCSPDHPCEMCQKCQPRCPQGKVELTPCMPHSDRQCGPPTSTPGLCSCWRKGDGVIVGISLGAVVCVLLVLYCLEKCYFRRSPGELRVQGVPLERSPWGTQGTQDNIRNEQFSQDQLLPKALGSVSPRAPRVEATVPVTSAVPRRNLVPVQGKDPITLLRQSFYVFGQVVPLDKWKRFGRGLDLMENDIDIALKEWSQENFFQMLNAWLYKQGTNASVNMLLETLLQMNLGGAAEVISTRLVQQGLFRHEVS
ncbi:Tumor necrosis factor receptor superfamily member 10B, partial [Buceros rhinoceros silvestris]